jgi:hypothetical protein
MGNDAHVPDIVLVLHQLIDLVCCGSSASRTVSATGGWMPTDCEVTGNRVGGEQIDNEDERQGINTYTMATNLGDNDDERAQRRRGTSLVSFSDQRKSPLYTNSTVTPLPDSEQVIRLCQRKRRRSRNVREHPVCLDRICLRIYTHLWRSTVPLHIPLLHASTVLHGLKPPREAVRLDHSRGDRNLGDERYRVKRRRRWLCTPHRPGVHRLYCGDRGVRVSHLGERISGPFRIDHGFTHLGPGDNPRLQYHLRFRPKVLGLPKDKVRESTDHHRANNV